MRLGLKLGSDPFKHGALLLDRYLTDNPPEVPATVSVPDEVAFPWGMLGNDTYGDCVPAALFHADESLYLKRGLVPYPYQTTECLALYFNVNGVPSGPPGSPSDQGTDPSAAMAWWQTKGLPGHKLAGFGQLSADSPNIRRAIWEFGAVIYCLALPDNWQTQITATGAHWRGTQIPDESNGHGIVGNGFTPELLTFVSWGQEGDMDNAFAGSCLEQVLVPLSADALTSADIGPAGYSFTAMTADLKVLTAA